MPGQRPNDKMAMAKIGKQKRSGPQRQADLDLERLRKANAAAEDYGIDECKELVSNNDPSRVCPHNARGRRCCHWNCWYEFHIESNSELFPNREPHPKMKSFFKENKIDYRDFGDQRGRRQVYCAAVPVPAAPVATATAAAPVSDATHKAVDAHAQLGAQLCPYNQNGRPCQDISNCKATAHSEGQESLPEGMGTDLEFLILMNRREGERLKM